MLKNLKMSTKRLENMFPKNSLPLQVRIGPQTQALFSTLPESDGAPLEIGTLREGAAAWDQMAALPYPKACPASSFKRLDIAEGSFPIASAIDVWVRDPPAVSTLPARGA